MTGNCTHLWVLATGERVPFGASIGRYVVGARTRVAQRELDPAFA